MHRTQRLSAHFLGSLLLLSLFACTTTPKGPPLETEFNPQKVAEAEQLLKEDKALGAVRLYQQLADGAEVPLRQRYQILAVETLFNHGYPELAVKHLSKIDDKGLEKEPQLQQRKRNLEVRAALAQHDGQQALRLLPPMEQATSRQQQSNLLVQYALAYEYSGQWQRALEALMQREKLLSGEQAIADNQQKIWQLLSSQSRDAVRQLRNSSRDVVVQGWAELNIIGLTPRLFLSEAFDAVRAWRTLYSSHPANHIFMQQLKQQLVAQSGHPPQIALLLPLSGRYRAAAEAVRDGLLAAHFQQDPEVPKPEIRIYDVGEGQPSARESYNQAVKQGAKLIIGPLEKEVVGEFSQLEQLPVPTLTLNYAEVIQPQPSKNLYQFGLLPEDEARQAAEAAIRLGYYKALALVPESSWGQRLADAFREQYEQLGGTLLDRASYGSKDSDFTAPIEQLMELGASNQRKKILQRVTGLQKIKFEPRRRQDVDMVFIAATPIQARLIKPQLKFHHSGDLPTLATSQVYSGGPTSEADNDMEGIMFCDTPWMLPESDSEKRLYNQFSILWPKSMQRYARLYALGYDAYQIAPYLRHMHTAQAPPFPGLTGTLSLDQNNRLHRALRWARFNRGEVKLLKLPATLQATDASH